MNARPRPLPMGAGHVVLGAVRAGPVRPDDGGAEDVSSGDDDGPGSEMARLRSLVAELRTEVVRARADGAGPAGDRSELELVVESMPQIVWTARPDGWHTYFNRRWCDFTGLTLQESLGHGWNPPFHPDDRPRAAALWRQATSTGEPYEIEYRLRRADGTYHWMLGRATPLRDAGGHVVTWFGTCTDIEELKQAQVRIEEQAQLLDLARDAILVEDPQQRVVYWNHGAERIFGWSADEALGRRLDELIGRDRDQIDAAVAVVHERGEWSGELSCVDKASAVRLVQSRWTLLLDADGAPKGVLTVSTDVTEQRATEATFIQMLEAAATHDPLTTLPNRALLTDRLDEAAAASRRDRTPLALLFVDLDHFKDINDGVGHLLGDRVLVEVAARLAGVLRDGDTVARFGGDEFVVLLPDTDVVTADAIAERLLGAVRQPLEVDGHRLQVSVSIGVAVSPPIATDALLGAADAAVYRAKSNGRAQVHPCVGPPTSQVDGCHGSGHQGSGIVVPASTGGRPSTPAFDVTG